MPYQREYEMNDGNRIPALGLGTWALRGTQCITIIKKALELGYTHIDTAEMYNNQKEIGVAIQGFDRSQIFLTSKVWRTNLHYNDVIKACKKTLEDLKTEYVDLFLIHWPNKAVPVKETLSAFQYLLEKEYVKSIGVSNFNINELNEVLNTTKLPITVNQVEFNPYLYQKELLAFCKNKGIILTAYTPLGKGNVLQERTIQKVSAKYNRTVAQICLRWGLQKGVVIIPKSGSENHLKENLDVFDWEITESDLNEIDLLNQNKRLINPEFHDFKD